MLEGVHMMSIDSEAAMAIALFAAVASVCWSAAFAWAKWLQHTRNQSTSAPQVDQRLERIERAIDTVAVEVERLGEGQRFTARLLRDANKAPNNPVEPYRVNTPQ
jgi:hypothetical protein